MSRYIDTLYIEFLDGTATELSANRARVHDGILTVSEENSYGATFNTHHFPLTGIRSYHWKDGQP